MSAILQTLQDNMIVILVLLAVPLAIYIAFFFGWKTYEYGEILVSDGDGLRFPGKNGRRGTNMRLDGFDAPEWNQPGGKEASDHLRSLVYGGVRFKRVGTCVYGRPIIRAKVLGTLFGVKIWRDVATLMCAAGHGHTDARFYTARGFAMLRARLCHRGVWKNAGLFGHRAIDPKLWRKADNAAQAQRRGTQTRMSYSAMRYRSQPIFKAARAIFPRNLL